MKHKLGLLLLLISFSINATEGFELGVSPTNFQINQKLNEESCHYLNIKTSSLSNISLRIEWNISENHQFIDFESQTLSVFNNSYTNFCLKSSKKGSFSANLFVIDMNGRAEIGIPLNLYITDNSKKNNIVGFSINEQSSNFNPIKIYLVFAIIQLIILSYLVIKLVRKVYI